MENRFFEKPILNSATLRKNVSLSVPSLSRKQLTGEQ
jgi:hypothetical protein